MPNHNTPYQLIQAKTGKVLMDGAFVKYYQDTPHCAVFAEYPAEETKIWVCRKVDPEEQDYGYRLATLISHGPSHEKIIGSYVKLFEATTEEEAEDRLIANLVGVAALRAYTYIPDKE